MFGQLDGVLFESGRVLRLQRAGYPLMETEPAGRTQLLIEGLAEEGVGEAVLDHARSGLLLQHADPGGFFQGGDQRLLFKGLS